MASRDWNTIWLLSTIFFFAVVVSQQAGTQCYVLDGAAGRGFFRCNNETTGHSSCCQIGHTCYSNGICMGENEGTLDYLREACTDPTWRDPACLDECVQYANGSTAGVRWCGDSLTTSTEYCCDTGAQGVGSFACCRNTSNLFVMSPAPTVVATILSTAAVAYPPSSTSSSSSSTSGTSGTSTTSAAATSTTSSSSSKSSVNGAAVGAGVGVPVAILLALGVAFFFWRRHRKSKAKKHAFELQSAQQPGYQQTPYADTTTGSYGGPYEAAGQATNSGYYAGGKYDPAPQSPPQELPLTNAHVVHEMGTVENQHN